MATTLSTFLAQLEILLGPDDSNLELSDTELETFVKAAVEQYSHDRPDDATTDVTGDGGRYYDIATDLTSWVEDFSNIVEIEYPAEAISEDAVPQYLDDEDWRDDYWSGGTRYLFLPNHAPAATETMRVKYTIPYTWTSNPEQTSTPAQDFYAICHLAAGLACRTIATQYSRTSSSSISADSVDHLTRASEFAQRASEYIEYYRQHMGLDTGPEGGVMEQGAGLFVDLDTSPTWPAGRRFLFHGKETR